MQVEYEPSMRLCLSFCTWIGTEQMKTTHRAVKRKLTLKGTIVCLALHRPFYAGQMQALKRERISRFKRESDKIRSDLLPALMAALGNYCPDQLHLVLNPHLLLGSPGARASAWRLRLRLHCFRYICSHSCSWLIVWISWTDFGSDL